MLSNTIARTCCITCWSRNLLQTEEVMKGWAVSGIHGVYAEEVFTGADIISQRSYDEFVFPV